MTHYTGKERDAESGNDYFDGAGGHVSAGGTPFAFAVKTLP